MSKTRFNKIIGARSFSSDDWFTRKGSYSYSFMVYRGDKLIGYAELV